MGGCGCTNYILTPTPTLLHSTVVDKSNCLLLSMNISTGRAEIFIANRTPRAVVHSTYLGCLSIYILPRDISFENLMSKLSLVKIS